MSPPVFATVIANAGVSVGSDVAVVVGVANVGELLADSLTVAAPVLDGT
jgi:hypothetical protein